MFDYDGWNRWREDRLREYPCQWGKWRYDIELAHPRDRLEDVPIERNPHSLGGFTGHSCFYKCNDWSTIYGVYDAQHPSGESLRMLIESENPEPLWGERIELLSTSSYIQTESWGRNPSNKFAFFRGRYWRIVWEQFLHHEMQMWDVGGGRVRYPIRMEPYPYDGRPVAGPRGTRTIRIPVFDMPNFDFPIFAPRNMEAIRRMLGTPTGHRSWSRRFEGRVDWRREGF